MNAVNPSAPNKRKAIAEEPTASGFFQALRDKSIYERLITPPGLKALAMAIVLSMLSGLSVFALADGLPTAVAADLATSFAFVMMFSLVLGSWLGVILGTIFNNLMTHIVGILESRTNRLIESVSGLRRNTVGNSGKFDDKTRDYRTSFVAVIYVMSFLMMGICSMLLLLIAYTYADNPSAESVVQQYSAIYTKLLYVSLTTGALLICGIAWRIARVWRGIRKLEKQFGAAAMDAEIRAFAPMDIGVADHITKAHKWTVRFVTGVF